MDIIARKMGWYPLEFRLKTMLRSGEQFATGETMHDVYFVECLEAAVKGLPPSPVRKDAEQGRRARGVGCAVMMKSTMANSKSQAKIKLSADGTVTLYTSTVEMGQGAHTT
ncbi:MAG: molybdopterin cofactor-binding domain-containing protein, partial [Chloroflexota bacterium]